MTIKHALIVDDSKSARAVLRRMLEDLSLKVDTVESADDAINFLKGQQPGVIFMDHLMPGMDGFEAVKHIKKNPHTAVIPIMMYTSRGGEVYLSQARALGAVGIIPKTISPVGLKESLFKLGLIDERRLQDRRKPESNANRPVVDKTDTASADRQEIDEDTYAGKKDYAVVLNDLNRLMDDQTIELHKSMWLGVESVSNEIFNRLHGELEEKFEKLHLEIPRKNNASWSLYVVTVLLLLSVMINVLVLTITYLSENNITASNKQSVYTEENLETGTIIENIPATSRQALDEFMLWAENKTIEYPFDELALNDNRLPVIEEIFQRAVETGYSGDIMLQTHVGVFCLSRDLEGNFKLADDDLPVTQCEYIGNHVQPTDLPTTHQSLSFANYLSDISLLHDKGIEVEVMNMSRSIEILRYPDQVPETKSKEWNLAARGNNRIRVKLIHEPVIP